MYPGCVDDGMVVFYMRISLITRGDHAIVNLHYFLYDEKRQSVDHNGYISPLNSPGIFVILIIIYLVIAMRFTGNIE